jgi:hypothetical protein
VVQWAAAHWQFNVCQLLLAKGADVEARNWGGIFKPATPLGMACSAASYNQFTVTNFRPKHATDTLGLLLESGLDTDVSVEIDYNLYYLSEGLTQRWLPHSIRRAVAQQFSWLMRKYTQDTTYGELAPCTEPHTGSFAAISVSQICFTAGNEFWSEERFDYGLFAHMDIQTFQSLWLFLVAEAAVYGDISPDISPIFRRAYTGDFHFQHSWDVDGEKGRDSPMQLALRSFAALGTFHSILMASGTDIVKFAEKESTMPWCNHSQETLVSLLSLQPQRYEDLASLFDTVDSCRCCHHNFEHDAVWDWEEIVASVENGKSLVSLLDPLVGQKEDYFGSSLHYCEDCELGMQTPCASGESHDAQAEGSDETAESDSEDNEDPLGGMQVSGMGYQQTEEGADASSSDESSSSSSFSDEDFGADAD